MPIVLNSNSAATEASFNLGKANEYLRQSIARLSSGNRITRSADDAGGLGVAYKLQSSMKRTEAALSNHQNALSYLQVQDGVLEATGEIVDRMAELRTLSADVSKSISDVENYSKEFVELQDQLNQMKREKFNGVELFATEEEWHSMKGVNKSHLKINGADYVNDGSDAIDGRNAISLGTKATYEYFDHPDQSMRTVGQYDKYEFQLYTHPTGAEENGNIKLNIVNLQFMLAVKDPSAYGVDKTSTYNSSANVDTDADGVISGAEWKAWTEANLEFGPDFPHVGDTDLDPDEIAAYESAHPGWKVQNEQGLGEDIDGNGGFTMNLGRITTVPDLTLYSHGTGSTISISNTINLAGLNQVTLDPGDGSVHVSNSNGTDYASWLNEDGYIKDITKVSVEEFTNIIEKIADARAENGAEQARVAQSLSLHQNNLVNLQAAHGRIMDVDVAMESTRLARNNVTVQASAAMVAQANQMTAIALTLLSQ
jgi:flagellin-like hook-associated protein FlgL